MAPAERRNQLPRLLRLYREDPDPGVHSAAEWLLRTWGLGEALARGEADLKGSKPSPARGWYLDSQAQWGARRGAEIGVAQGEGFRQYLGHPYPKDNLLLSLVGG